MKSFFGVVTSTRHRDMPGFIGEEIVLSYMYTFLFPGINESEFKVGRRVFMDFEAWPNDESVLIHIFKSDKEMEKECDGAVFDTDICYVISYRLLRRFIPWVPVATR